MWAPLEYAEGLQVKGSASTWRSAYWLQARCVCVCMCVCACVRACVRARLCALVLLHTHTRLSALDNTTYVRRSFWAYNISHA